MATAATRTASEARAAIFLRVGSVSTASTSRWTIVRRRCIGVGRPGEVSSRPDELAFAFGSSAPAPEVLAPQPMRAETAGQRPAALSLGSNV